MYQFLELPNLEKYYSENQDSIIFAFLAFRNLEQGNVERALSICEQGVEKHPQYPFGHFVLGLCHYHLKDYSKAKTYLEIAAAYDDKNPKAWKLLGEINEQLDLSLLAEECNQKYYLLDSFNPEALEKYQKEELIDFDAFRTDFSPEEMPPTDVKKDSKILEDESELDTFLNKTQEEDEDLDLSKEAADNYEEPPGDVSYTQEDEKVEPKYSEKEDQEAEDRMETNDVRSESEFESKPTELDESEKDVVEESRSMDKDKDISAADETEPEQSDQLLDFRSVVKDIISEDEEHAGQPLEEEPEAEMDIEASTENLEQDETEESDKIVDRPPILTPTIGEIYIAQGRFDDAIDVFEQLLEKEPDNQRYQKKIKDVKAIIEKQKLGSIGD